MRFSTVDLPSARRSASTGRGGATGSGTAIAAFEAFDDQSEAERARVEAERTIIARQLESLES